MTALLLAMILAAGMMTGCGKKEEPTADTGKNAASLTDAVNAAVDGALEETPDEKEPAEDASAANVQLTDAAKQALASLETDYNSINWGSVYTLGDYEGIVVSVAPYEDDMGFWSLFVGITNLYDSDISFYAEAEALGADGESCGECVYYTSAIGSGNTVIGWFYCSDTEPDGRIHWSDIEVEEAFGKYSPWECDWSLKGSIEDMQLEYHIYCPNEEKEVDDDDLIFLILDDNGNIIGWADDYIDTCVGKEGYSTTIDVYDYNQSAGNPAGVAVFANTITDED